MPGGPDPYLLPNGTLNNKLGISDQEALAAAEADIVSSREGTLRGRLPRPPFSFDTLRSIHRSLFADVYEWAGEPRSIGLSKRDQEGPGGRLTTFTPPASITAEARAIFDKLQAVGWLEGMSRPEFAARAAQLLVDINNLHWAREGNGRSQRLLLEAVAANAGHPASFDAATKERMIRCSVAGSRGDPEPMKRLFHDICDPERVEALRAAIRALEAHGQGIRWNDLYVATTVTGRRYSGLFAGQSAGKFMLRVGQGSPDDWIAVGATVDLPPGVAPGTEISFTATRFVDPTEAHPA